jgi:hypothetical protein
MIKQFDKTIIEKKQRRKKKFARTKNASMIKKMIEKTIKKNYQK